MDRRVWGTALVAFVLLAALIAPNLAGRRIVGTAGPVPVADPPRVGQCLLAAVDGGRSALEFNQVTVAAAGVGPCGEHGGDPESIHFFHTVGLDYVSCSPFRVPVARLEAGRAAVS